MKGGPGDQGRARVMAWVLLAVALAAGGGLMARAFGGPWSRLPWLGRNGARYSIIARNYDRIGFLETHLAPVLSAGDSSTVPRRYYLHHPPLLPLTLGLLYRELDSPSEDAVRSVAALFSALNIVLLFWLGRQFGGWLAAGLVAVIAAVAPMTSVYGVHVDVQGPQVLSFILLTWALLWRYRGDGRSPTLLLALGAFVLGMTSDWPAFYPGLVVPVVWWLDRGKHPLRLGVVMVLLAVGVFALLELQATLVGDPGAEMAASLRVRSFEFLAALRDRPSEVWTAFQARLGDFSLLFPWPMLVLGLVGLAPGARRGTRLWASGLIAVGVIHVVLFPAGALVHDYWTFAVQPGVVLLSGLGLTRLLAPAARTIQRVRALRFCGLVLAGLFVWFSLSAWRTRLADRYIDVRHVVMGRALAANSAARSVVLTNAPYNPFGGQSLSYPQFSYYADRWVTGGITSMDRLREARQRIPADEFLLVPPEAFPASLDPERTRLLESALETLGTRRDIDRGLVLFDLSKR